MLKTSSEGRILKAAREVTARTKIRTTADFSTESVRQKMLK